MIILKSQINDISVLVNGAEGEAELDVLHEFSLLSIPSAFTSIFASIHCHLRQLGLTLDEFLVIIKLNHRSSSSLPLI